MWYHETTESILRSLSAGAGGLSAAEAAARAEKYGENLIGTKKKKSFPRRFFGAMLDRMTVVLLIAAGVSFAASLVGGGSYADPIIILLIVLINAFIATVQESRAEHALEALKRMQSPESTVIRDGTPTRIQSRYIVPGDVILLQKGDIIPCDARLLRSNGLCVDESALTGESMGVSKNAHAKALPGAPMSECESSVFSSCAVLTGSAAAIAVKTGVHTAVGEIAEMIGTENEQTPLQKRLAKLGTVLGNGALAICALIFVFSLIKGMDVGEMFMTSVSLSVAAIPEGLPAIVTVVLSAGVKTMAHRRAVVKRLPAVETLGNAQVICTDKTGTLTCNEMKVVRHSGSAEDIARVIARCGDDSSPTELALAEFAKGFRAAPECAAVTEIPFDPNKKYMMSVYRESGGYRTYIKGAPDVIARFCRSGGAQAAETAADWAEQALRVIAFARSGVTAAPPDSPENAAFELVGLCGISDPPRPEARDAVEACRKAGIRVIMLTGDHPATAGAVAREVGIMRRGERVLTESDTASMSAREFDRAVKECNVFARVTPRFKLRVVESLSRSGKTVAMTGDGVNDAPALKRADIGAAMGISGTEAAKEAADMILTDDNFATVVSAVREGRGIFDNIRRAVHFLLSCNIGELFTVFFAIIVSLPSPLSAIQLLWVNLTTDSLPAISLGLEGTHGDVMERRPFPKNAPLFGAERVFRIVFEGLLIGTLAITAFAVGNARGGFLCGRTMCFTVLSVSQLFHSFNMRSERSIFRKGIGKNRFVTAAFFICFALQASVILIPSAAALFGVCALSAAEWGICIALSATPVAVCEIYKALRY